MVVMQCLMLIKESYIIHHASQARELNNHIKLNKHIVYMVPESIWTARQVYNMQISSPHIIIIMCINM